MSITDKIDRFLLKTLIQVVKISAFVILLGVPIIVLGFYLLITIGEREPNIAFSNATEESISLSLQSRLENSFQKQSRQTNHIKINLNEWIGKDTWDYFCYFGGYHNTGETLSRFNIQTKNSPHLNYEIPEASGLILIIKNQTIIPIKETLHIDGQHVGNCYSSRETFKLGLGIFDIKKDITFEYQPTSPTHLKIKTTQ